jgi:hypothetical protein
VNWLCIGDASGLKPKFRAGTGTNPRVVVDGGRKKTLPAIPRLQIEPFGDEAGALTFMEKCRALGIKASSPKQIGMAKS